MSTSQQLRQHRPVMQEPAERATAPASSGFGVRSRRSGATTVSSRASASSSSIPVGSVRLRVLEAGSGEPVLLVHGTGPYWAPLVRERPGFEHEHQEDAWRQAPTR